MEIRPVQPDDVPAITTLLADLGSLGLFSKLTSAISLAFLERYPSSADARGLGEARLRAFLARKPYSGGQKPA
ncbi:MAG: hypothetical protein JO304_15610, partial [Solirubrobacterales bacterium]|nr:hypothetical protein [Solirubrobacterales bacterium]